MHADPDAILGLAKPSPEGRFPLLVKFLDAAEHLSVQVHPDAAYAAAVRGAHLKTEAWVVLDAQPGAVLYRGVRPEVTPERFFAKLSNGSVGHGEVDFHGDGVVQHLVAVPVERGDCIYLPSGICHALGAGILVAEVQTPSDTTFRVFDWDRGDPARPLHVEQARRCMRFGLNQEDGCPGIVRRKTVHAIQTPTSVTRVLCRTKFFAIESIELRPAAELSIVTDGAPVIWCVTEGEADLMGPDGRALRLRTGDTALMPARLQRWIARFPERTSLLRVTVPTTLDTLLAAT